MSTNARRLAEAVLARRKELDLTQLEVWQAGGPSNTTLTAIENAETPNLVRATARKLDVGLQWEPGSARAVWEGGEPRPVASIQPGRVDDQFVEMAQRSDISDQFRADLLAAIEAERRRQEEATRRSS